MIWRNIISSILAVSLVLHGCTDQPKTSPGSSAPPAPGTASKPTEPPSNFPSGTLAVSFKEEAGLNDFDWIGEATKGGIKDWRPGGGGGDLVSGLVVLTIALIGGMFALAKTGIGNVIGSMDEKKWKPCEDRVRAAVDQLDLHALARDALVKSFQGQGLDSVVWLAEDGGSALEQSEKLSANWFLQISFGKLSWLDSPEGLYSAARLSAGLWDVSNRSYSRTWLFEAVRDSQSQTLATLCQGDTQRLVKAEIERLYHRLSRQIAQFPDPLPRRQ